MAVRLVTFSGETVTPTDDGVLYEAALPASGIIYGCEVTIADANTLRIATGYAIICGRFVEITATDVQVVLSSSGTLLGQLYLHMDLSDAGEPLSVRYETGTELTPMQQDANVNITNGVYEMQLAQFKVNTSTILDLAQTAVRGLKSIANKDIVFADSTVTDDDKVLSAKEANPNLYGSMARAISEKVSGSDFIVRTYLATAAASIGANGVRTFTFTDLRISGYKPISIVSYNLPNGKSFMVTLPQDLLGSDSNSCQIVVGSVNGSGGAIQPALTILYIRS